MQSQTICIVHLGAQFVTSVIISLNFPSIEIYTFEIHVSFKPNFRHFCPFLFTRLAKLDVFLNYGEDIFCRLLNISFTFRGESSTFRGNHFWQLGKASLQCKLIELFHFWGDHLLSHFLIHLNI